MSDESKKILWISVALVGCFLILILAALFVFTPRGSGAEAPASPGNLATPRAPDPQDYLNAPAAPLSGAPASGSGDLIVIYGDKPANLPATSSAGAYDAAGVAAAAGAASSGAAAYGAPIAGGAASADPVVAGQSTAAAQPASPVQAAPAPVAKAPASAPKPAAAPAKTPAAAPSKPAAVPAKAAVPRGEEYWIQAASFSSRGRADELKSALAQRGLAALIAVKDIDGKSWYRVRIGPYASKAEAEGWAAKVKAVPGCAEAMVMKSGG